jgi:regulator of nonsense transcripts 2
MPKPNSDNPLDAPNDWFRIRLICILLETCASFFDKGPSKKKLDFFVTFFQVSNKQQEGSRLTEIVLHQHQGIVPAGH